MKCGACSSRVGVNTHVEALLLDEELHDRVLVGVAPLQVDRRRVRHLRMACEGGSKWCATRRGCKVKPFVTVSQCEDA